MAIIGINTRDGYNCQQEAGIARSFALPNIQVSGRTFQDTALISNARDPVILAARTTTPKESGSAKSTTSKSPIFGQRFAGHHNGGLSRTRQDGNQASSQKESATPEGEGKFLNFCLEGDMKYHNIMQYTLHAYHAMPCRVVVFPRRQISILFLSLGAWRSVAESAWSVLNLLLCDGNDVDWDGVELRKKLAMSKQAEERKTYTQ